MTTKDSPTLLLPEGACLLHIGPPKTGSSSIQLALEKVRAEVRGHGVVYPGSGRRAMSAGWAVLGETPRGYKLPSIAAWQRLVYEVGSASDQRVCVSTERFSCADPKHVTHMIEDLGRDGVHVVAVARRLDRILPSALQQRVKAFETVTYQEFLEIVLGDESPDHPLHRSFWRSQGIEQIAERWSEGVGPEHVHPIVTDEDDRGMLASTFEQLLGLPAGMLPPSESANASMDQNGTGLVRRMNQGFAGHAWPDDVYYQTIRLGALRMLQNGPRSPSDAPLPPWAATRVAEVVTARVEALRAIGIQIIADAEDMLPPPQAGGEDLGSPPELIPMDAAVRAVEGAVAGAVQLVVVVRARHEKEVEKLGRQHTKALQKLPAQHTPRQPRSVEPTTTKELASEVRARGIRRVTSRSGTRRPNDGDSG